MDNPDYGSRLTALVEISVKSDFIKFEVILNEIPIDYMDGL